MALSQCFGRWVESSVSVRHIFRRWFSDVLQESRGQVFSPCISMFCSCLMISQVKSRRWAKIFTPEEGKSLDNEILLLAAWNSLCFLSKNPQANKGRHPSKVYNGKSIYSKRDYLGLQWQRGYHGMEMLSLQPNYTHPRWQQGMARETPRGLSLEAMPTYPLPELPQHQRFRYQYGVSDGMMIFHILCEDSFEYPRKPPTGKYTKPHAKGLRKLQKSPPKDRKRKRKKALWTGSRNYCFNKRLWWNGER